MKIEIELSTLENIRFMLRQIVDCSAKRQILDSLRKAEAQAKKASSGNDTPPHDAA